MARLSAGARKALPGSEFAGPNRSFPVNDPSHIRAALSLQRFASPATKAKIYAAAKRAGIKAGGNSAIVNRLTGKGK